MKIIEEHHGKRIVCDSCQSVLEYNKRDINYEQTNYNRFDEYVVCPVCDHKIYIVIN